MREQRSLVLSTSYMCAICLFALLDDRIKYKRAMSDVIIHVVGCEQSLHPCLRTGVEAPLASYLFPGFSEVLTVHY